MVVRLIVSYRGAAPANTDLLGGQVPAMFNNPINALPQIRAGSLGVVVERPEVIEQIVDLVLQR